MDTRKGCFSVTEMSGDAASHADWEYGLAMMDDREDVMPRARGRRGEEEGRERAGRNLHVEIHYFDRVMIHCAIFCSGRVP